MSETGGGTGVGGVAGDSPQEWVDNGRRVPDGPHLARAHGRAARQGDMAHITLDVGVGEVAVLRTLWQKTVFEEQLPVRHHFGANQLAHVLDGCVAESERERMRG